MIRILLNWFRSPAHHRWFEDSIVLNMEPVSSDWLKSYDYNKKGW